MKKIVFLLTFLALALFAKENSTPIVRMADIEIDCQYIEEYKTFLKESSEASLKLESGVWILYAMWEQENPCVFKIVEAYADEQSYQKHLQTPHFQKYKRGTLKMVKSLKLINMDALNPKMSLNKDFE